MSSKLLQLKLGYVSGIVTVVTVQQLPQSEQEVDLWMLLRALALKLMNKLSELTKTLHSYTELQPQETGSREGVEDVTEHCFEENDW